MPKSRLRRPKICSGGKPGAGDTQSKIIDKVIEEGEKVVKALIHNTSVDIDWSRFSVLPADLKPNEVKDSQTGSLSAVGFDLTNIFGMTGATAKIKLDYMACTVFDQPGRFLKDITVKVEGFSILGTSIAIQVTYGEPENAGEKNDWIAEVVVDIEAKWNPGLS